MIIQPQICLSKFLLEKHITKALKEKYFFFKKNRVSLEKFNQKDEMLKVRI